MFICPFADHALDSHYYWNGGSFKVPHFLNFYLQIFVFSYFIVLSDWYIIICWFCYINKKTCFFITSLSGLLILILTSISITKSQSIVASLAFVIGSGWCLYHFIEASFNKWSSLEFPQVSRTFLSILADLNITVVWMVPVLFLISNSSRFFSKHI